MVGLLPMFPMRVVALVVISASYAGCSLKLVGSEAATIEDSVVVGQVVTVLTGERGRIYPPRVRSIELENHETKDRVTVDIESEDKYVALKLTPGMYRINRVQISEGPFLSIAQMDASFSASRDIPTYVGIWRFGVGTPSYDRMVMLSAVLDADEQAKAQNFLASQHPEWAGFVIANSLPDPSAADVRVYEVMPYPRYPTYFRRHAW